MYLSVCVCVFAIQVVYLYFSPFNVPYTRILVPKRRFFDIRSNTLAKCKDDVPFMSLASRETGKFYLWLILYENMMMFFVSSQGKKAQDFISATDE